MSQTLRDRKPPVPRRQKGSTRTPPPVKPSPAARGGRRRRLSRGHSVFLLAMTYGSAVALLVVVVGFASLVKNGAVPEGALGPQAGAAGGHHHANNNGGPQPNIRIEARHVGNLVVDIKADLSLNKTRDAIMKAKAAVYLDMAQMPGAHAMGPLPLKPAQGKPGRYETMATVPMPGDYKLRVVVSDPVPGEKTTTVNVGTVPYGGSGQGGAPAQGGAPGPYGGGK